jgi:mono/diheme cytochrome c family protein
MKRTFDMFKHQSIVSVVLPALAVILLSGCAAKGDYPGREYAANMYHSVAYEPLSQITDEDAGAWVNSLDNRSGEYFNSNRYNPHRMNMREPAPNTVKRNKYGWLPYRFSKDSLAYAAKVLKNPFDSSAAVLADGKVLYETYCKHCHGSKGEGDGKVAQGVTIDGVQKGQVAGVANLRGDALKNISEGHIFHVITMGKGLMGSHGGQINPDERWKIAKYVKTLQK